MDEPSVLDFVLEKLAFWRESKVVIPSAEEGKKPPIPDIPGDQKSKLAWKKLFFFLPPLFAITAQIFSEPPNRTPSLVIFFYIAAVGGLLLLIFFRDWQIEPLIPEEGEAGIITVRYVLFGIGIVFGVFAFLFFLANQFNLVNVSLWVTSLILIWMALWTPENWWEKSITAWKRFWEDGIRITYRRLPII